MVCFGEFFLEFVPTVREISIDDALIFEKAPGGAPANVAFGIAKLWRNAAFVDKRQPVILAEHHQLFLLGSGFGCKFCALIRHSQILHLKLCSTVCNHLERSTEFAVFLNVLSL